MWLIARKDTQEVVHCSGLVVNTKQPDLAYSPPIESTMLKAVEASGQPETNLAAFEITDVDEARQASTTFSGDGLTATFIGDQIIAVQQTLHPAIYCHLTLSGPSGGSPPRIKADGIEEVQADIKLTLSDDINADPLPVDAAWPIVIRRTDGSGYINKMVSVAQGAGSTSFSTTVPTDWEVRESDFNPQDLSAFGLGVLPVKLLVYPVQPNNLEGVARIYAYEE